MPSKVFSTTSIGIEAHSIEVEVDVIPGLHVFNIVGLPDKAIKESKDRIASAIRNIGLIPPNAKNLKVIVNLAPANIKKEGPAYDLPIAIGYLLATNQIKFNPVDKLFIGELSLNGSLRHVNGVLPAILMAKNLNFKEVILPKCNAKEASFLSDNLSVIGVDNLSQLVDYLNGSLKIKPENISREMFFKNNLIKEDLENDMSNIKGQESAKRALEIAAAGSHNILMNGVPGAGKTMLARALTTILPNLRYEEVIEVTRIFSVAGLLSNGKYIINRPQFRSPHHTSSTISIIGGGSWPKPGEISLAHRGVLFLDEFPEFSRATVESLRQPIEDGCVTISRISGSLTLPSKFMFVAAMNPCPCGNYEDSNKICVCSPITVANYRKKISGPILDRIDIKINISREMPHKLDDNTETENSDFIRKRVEKSREIQYKRLNKYGIFTNSEMSNRNIKEFCELIPKTKKYLQDYVLIKHLSNRSYFRILKVARTIADLEESEDIKLEHINEAIRYKSEEHFT